MILRYIFKILKLIWYNIAFKISWIITYFKFCFNGVKFHSDYTAKGIPIISVSLTGKMLIGKKFGFNSGKYFNMIGRQQQCYFIVGANATLEIGDNVGMSSCAIVCHQNIEIAADVRVGGGVVIYDTDFHSLDVFDRVSIPEILDSIRTSPVRILRGAFIGAHSIILKGVTIGENSIIGAGSVVSKSIPANEVWAGNPAKFIKKLD